MNFDYKIPSENGRAFASKSASAYGRGTGCYAKMHFFEKYIRKKIYIYYLPWTIYQDNPKKPHKLENPETMKKIPGKN